MQSVQWFTSGLQPGLLAFGCLINNGRHETTHTVGHSSEHRHTVVGGGGLPGAGTAPGPRVIDIEKLKDNLYVLTSSKPGDPATFSGGNVAVFITDGGVTLVDPKLAGWGQAILDKLKTVTDKPVTRIINTHTHGDHTGNDGFFGTTVEIVAQDNTKANMEKMDAFKGITRSSCRRRPTRTS